MNSILGSLKILDFTALLPGPLATMMLADMGADVIRVEAPSRPDLMRQIPPFDGEHSAWHSVLNRSKRSICLDLKTDKALDVVSRLVQTHDIVVEQFRPGVMERLGLGYEAMKQIKPDIIYCSITGYGQTGPWKDRAGHDNNYLSTAGIMGVSGRKNQRPPIMGVQVADVAGGSYGALTGILAAVVNRLETGKGQYIDISMLDAMVHMNLLPISQYLVSGDEPGQEDGWLNGGGFYDYYSTSDGRALSVGSLELKFRKGLAAALELEELETRLDDEGSDAEKTFKDAIARKIASKPMEHWVNVFKDRDVCVEPVLRISEVIKHPQIAERKMIQDVPCKDGGMRQQVAFPFRFSGASTAYRHTGLRAGETTDEILTEAGYSLADIRIMRENGVFG